MLQSPRQVQRFPYEPNRAFVFDKVSPLPRRHHIPPQHRRRRHRPTGPRPPIQPHPRPSDTGCDRRPRTQHARPEALRCRSGFIDLALEIIGEGSGFTLHSFDICEAGSHRSQVWVLLFVFAGQIFRRRRSAFILPLPVRARCRSTWILRYLQIVDTILIDCALRPEECFRLRPANVVDGGIEIHYARPPLLPGAASR